MMFPVVLVVRTSPISGPLLLGCVPGTECDDTRALRIGVGRHLADDDCAALQVLLALLATQLGKLVWLFMAVWEPIGIDGIEG